MKVRIFGLSKGQQGKVEQGLRRAAEAFANGDPIHFTHETSESGEVDVKVEGAKYIASTRLTTMLREELPRLVAA